MKMLPSDFQKLRKYALRTTIIERKHAQICFAASHAHSRPGIGNIFITVGRIACSYICRGPQRNDNVVDSKRICISLSLSVSLAIT
jgi:hypothetical protein